jgi:hypothetical protein
VKRAKSLAMDRAAGLTQAEADDDALDLLKAE